MIRNMRTREQTEEEEEKEKEKDYYGGDCEVDIEEGDDDDGTLRETNDYGDDVSFNGDGSSSP